MSIQRARETIARLKATLSDMDDQLQRRQNGSLKLAAENVALLSERLEHEIEDANINERAFG